MYVDANRKYCYPTEKDTRKKMERTLLGIYKDINWTLWGLKWKYVQTVPFSFSSAPYFFHLQGTNSNSGQHKCYILSLLFVSDLIG